MTYHRSTLHEVTWTTSLYDYQAEKISRTLKIAAEKKKIEEDSAIAKKRNMEEALIAAKKRMLEEVAAMDKTQASNWTPHTSLVFSNDVEDPSNL